MGSEAKTTEAGTFSRIFVLKAEPYVLLNVRGARCRLITCFHNDFVGGAATAPAVWGSSTESLFTISVNVLSATEKTLKV